MILHMYEYPPIQRLPGKDQQNQREPDERKIDTQREVF